MRLPTHPQRLIEQLMPRGWVGDLRQKRPRGLRPVRLYFSPRLRSPRAKRNRARVPWVRYGYLSFAVVVQRAGRRWTCDAGDGTQILVDGPEVMVSHVVIDGPRHDLEEITVERRREAVCGHGS